MKTSLSAAARSALEAPLAPVERRFRQRYPGEATRRQPVHTVYGGAHLFRADTAARLGRVALRHLEAYFPDFLSLAAALELPGADELPPDAAGRARLALRFDDDPEAVAGELLAARIYRRVLEKLRREPVEDFRIDFEDGFGHRSDEEEDREAVRAAREVARGLAEGTLPPFVGIRVKPFSEELRERSLRTLDLFVTALVDAAGGLPPGFVVTLPKVSLAEEIAALVAAFEHLERETGLETGALELEIMVETPQSLLGADGRSPLPEMVPAAAGRLRGAHFGVYDYTASCGITARYQRMRHPVCDFARHAMQVAFAQTGVELSDGATNVLPVGPHRAAAGEALGEVEERRNREVVVRASRLAYGDVLHSLRSGIYQGWDLHPAQLPVRYAAVYGFFLSQLDEATERLEKFVSEAARATLTADVFDDAATGQALLTFFLRALNCGAVTPEEVARTGLAPAELRGRSFRHILENRQREKT